MGVYGGVTNSWINLSPSNSLNGLVTSGLVLALDAGRTLSLLNTVEVLVVGRVLVASLGGQEHPEHQVQLALWQRLDIQACPVIVHLDILVGQVHLVLVDGLEQAV